MVTADISSLYTIIQHNDALLALNWAFSQKEDIPFVQKKFLRLVLEYCLSHNYFWYGGALLYSKERCCDGRKVRAKFSKPLHERMGGQIYLCREED